jgi:hypothetical protein
MNAAASLPDDRTAHVAGYHPHSQYRSRPRQRVPEEGQRPGRSSRRALTCTRPSRHARRLARNQNKDGHKHLSGGHAASQYRRVPLAITNALMVTRCTARARPGDSAVLKVDPSLRQPPRTGHRRWAMSRLVDPALSIAAGHIRSCITGRVGNVRATSEKPAAANIAMVPV